MTQKGYNEKETKPYQDIPSYKYIIATKTLLSRESFLKSISIKRLNPSKWEISGFNSDIKRTCTRHKSPLKGDRYMGGNAIAAFHINVTLHPWWHTSWKQPCNLPDNTYLLLRTFPSDRSVGRQMFF